MRHYLCINHEKGFTVVKVYENGAIRRNALYYNDNKIKFIELSLDSYLEETIKLIKNERKQSKIRRGIKSL